MQTRQSRCVCMDFLHKHVSPARRLSVWAYDHAQDRPCQHVCAEHDSLQARATKCTCTFPSACMECAHTCGWTCGLQALTAALAPKAKVVRDGDVKTIDAINLVPGDVIIIKFGDIGECLHLAWSHAAACTCMARSWFTASCGNHHTCLMVA